MATTRREFLRNLDNALAGMDYTVDGDRISTEANGRMVEITLAPLPARVLSPLLKLERWKVTIEFEGYNAAGEQAFMDRFDQVFQRGGG